jgi:hypothetical protein
MRRGIWGAAVAAVVLSACEGGSSGNAQPTPTGAVTQTVDASVVTTVASTNGPLAGTTVIVPAGAMPNQTKVTIDVGTAPSQPGVALVGKVVSFTAQSGGTAVTSFSTPVDIEVPFDRTALPLGLALEDLVLFTAPNATATPTPVAGAIIDGAAGLARASVSHFSLYWVGARNGSLVGSYRVFFAGSGFETPQTNVSGAVFTLTFDGVGVASVSEWSQTFWGTHWAATPDYHPAPTDIDFGTPQAPPTTFGYALSSTGKLTIIQGGAAAFTGTLTPDGQVFADVTVERTVSGSLYRYQLNDVLGIRTSSGRDASALSGRFLVQGRRTAFDSTFDSTGSPIVLSDVGYGAMEVVFDGAGACSIEAGTGAYFQTTYGSPLAVQPPSPTGVYVDSSGPGAAACTYSVDPDGQAHFLVGGDEQFVGYVDPSGTRFAALAFALAYPFATETDYMQVSYTGLKLGSGFTSAALAGSYWLATGDAGFEEDPTAYVVNSFRAGTHAALTLDGAGGCTIANATSESAEDRFGVTDGTTEGAISVHWTDAITTVASCTYSVTDGGLVTVVAGGTPLTFQASLDGGYLVDLSSSTGPNGGATKYQVERRTAVRLTGP